MMIAKICDVHYCVQSNSYKRIEVLLFKVILLDITSRCSNIHQLDPPSWIYWFFKNVTENDPKLTKINKTMLKVLKMSKKLTVAMGISRFEYLYMTCHTSLFPHKFQIKLQSLADKNGLIKVSACTFCPGPVLYRPCFLLSADLGTPPAIAKCNKALSRVKMWHYWLKCFDR